MMKKTIYIVIILALVSFAMAQAQEIQKYSTTDISKSISGSNSSPAYALNNSDGSFLVSWMNMGITTPDTKVYCALGKVKKNGKIKFSKPRVITDEKGLNLDPSLAFNSKTQSYMAVWFNEVSGKRVVRGRVLSKKGSAAGSIINIAEDAGASFLQPRVVARQNSEGFIVLFSKVCESADAGESGVFAMQVDADGSNASEAVLLQGAGADASSGAPRHSIISRAVAAGGEMAVVITKRYNDPFSSAEIKSDDLVFTFNDALEISATCLAASGNVTPGELLPNSKGVFLNWFDFMGLPTVVTVQNLTLSHPGAPKKKGKLQKINGGKKVCLSALAEVNNSYYCFYTTDGTDMNFTKLNKRGKPAGKPGKLYGEIVTDGRLLAFQAGEDGKIILISKAFQDFGYHLLAYSFDPAF